MKITWLKLDVDIFNDGKIRLIRRMPGGDLMLLTWVGLMCLAMKSHRPGTVYIAEDVVAQPEDIAVCLEIPVETVKAAIIAFERLKMVHIEKDGAVTLTKFRDHQAIDEIERRRLLNRERVRRHRVTHYSITGNATDLDLDLEREKNKRPKNQKLLPEATTTQRSENGQGDHSMASYDSKPVLGPPKGCTGILARSRGSVAPRREPPKKTAEEMLAEHRERERREEEGLARLAARRAEVLAMKAGAK